MSRERLSGSPGLQAMYDKYIGDDPESVAHYERARADAEVAQSIYDLRTGAGLSQRELAEKIGTTASAISRLEDADYSGHSMAMLRRVAEALGRRVEVRFPPIDPEAGMPKPGTGEGPTAGKKSPRSTSTPPAASDKKMPKGKAAGKAGDPKKKPSEEAV